MDGQVRSDSPLKRVVGSGFAMLDRGTVTSSPDVHALSFGEGDTALTDADLLALIEAVGDTRDLRIAAEALGRVYGYTFADFSAVIPQARPGLQVLRISNFPEGWDREWKGQGIDALESILNQARAGGAPVFWDQVQIRDLVELSLMQGAFAKGLAHGVSYVAHGARGSTATISLASERNPFEHRKVRGEVGFALRAFGHLLLEAALRLVPSSESCPRSLLTRRERDVLTLTAAGKKNDEIAAALHLSPRTVLFHIESAGHKVGVSGRHRILQRAILIGAIDPMAHAIGAGLTDYFRGAIEIPIQPSRAKNRR